jgi:hypothetical protein
MGQINFETGLRSYKSTDKLYEKEKNWRNIPKKDKSGELPKLYPSYQETMNIKNWTTKNPKIPMHSAL